MGFNPPFIEQPHQLSHKRRLTSRESQTPSIRVLRPHHKFVDSRVPRWKVSTTCRGFMDYARGLQIHHKCHGLHQNMLQQMFLQVQLAPQPRASLNGSKKHAIINKGIKVQCLQQMTTSWLICTT